MTAATSGKVPETALPTVPAPRASACPLAPAPEFAQWREADGLKRVLYKGRDAWAVNRYTDIRSALVDPRLSARTIPESQMPSSPNDNLPVLFPRVDDPEHHRLRLMMTRDFTVRRADAMRPQIQELVDRHLDAMIDHGPPVDLVQMFSLPVPSLVIALMLGVPPDDLEMFHQATLDTTDVNKTDEQKAQSFAVMFGYLWELLGRKESEPGDDLLTRLLTDYVNTGELSRETAAINGVIMMQAGHETTANMIALGTVTLLEHREVFDRLARGDDEDLVVRVVDELMRYLSIVHAEVERVATEDFTLGGELIRAGDYLVMNLPAGNWDSAFVANSEQFDVDRKSRGHLSFGFGVHQCIGQNLARAEMQIAIGTLARRLPGLRLAVPPRELRFKDDHSIYGVNELPVAW